MKSHCLVLTVLLLLIGFATPPNRAGANPLGEAVAAGSATFNRSLPGALTINQSSDKVIINWNSFSIGLGEVTKFVQPSASSAALNRVLSANPSQIYGSLQANGRIFLINPNGILVGPNGQINTANLTLSTLDVSDSSFLAGAGLKFAGNSAAGIRNEGAIQALGGDVFLIARTVENAGSISAPQGTVGLAAGSEVLLTPAGDERISVLAGNANAPVAANGVNNQGSIQAATAELKAAGGNIYALAINNGGIVRANGVVNENGRLVLKATGGNILNSGTLAARNADGSGGSIVVDGGRNAAAPATVINSGVIEARGEAAGAKGGEVKLLGDRVGLLGTALVDVSGDGGGGTALIGGDFQGANPDVPNAERTLVGSESRIRADALGNGDGGKVIVWSDLNTRFLGSISARGGAAGGRGGFAEVSGKLSLLFFGRVDLRAPFGPSGQLLLDPKNITISTADPGGGAVSRTLATDLNDFTDNPTETSWLKPADLVTLLTAADVTLKANNDITFQDPVNASAATHNLSLFAGRSITFASGANLTLGGGSFSATFNEATALAANRDAGQAVFSMASGTTIAAPGGVSITAGTLAADSSGATSVNANTGDITLANLNTTPPFATMPGVAGGDIAVNNAAAGGTGKNISVAGTLTSSGAKNTASGGNRDGGASGNIALTASGSVSSGSLVATGGDGSGTSGMGGDGGTIDITAGTGITLDNNITSAGGTGAGASDGNAKGVTLAATAGGVSQSASTALKAATLALTGSGTFDINQSGNNVVTFAANVTGSVTYKDADNLILGTVGGTKGVTSANNPVAVSTVNGSLTVSDVGAGNDVDSGSSTVTLTAGGDNSLLTIGANVAVNAQGGANLIGDRIAIDTSVNNALIDAGTATVTAQPFSNTRLINLGNAAASSDVNASTATTGTLDINAFEFHNITAGTLKVGSAGSGNLAVTGPIVYEPSPPALSSTLLASTLSLQSGGQISQGAGEFISVPNLALQAVGAITLTDPLNAVGTLAASGSGAITFKNSAALTLGSVSDGVTTINGISAVNSPIDISTVNGNLTVADAGVGNDVTAGSSTVTLTAGGAPATDRLLTLNPNATVRGLGGVTLIADNISIDPTSGINAGAATATLRQFENGTTVNLGGADAAGVLGLTKFELRIVQAGTLRIGDANSGDITISDILSSSDVPALQVNTLSLQTGGAISQNPGASIKVGTLIAKTLNNAGGAITLNDPLNDVTTLNLQARNAADSANANGAINYRDASGFDVASALSGSTVTLTAGGAITESGTIAASTLTAKTLLDAGAAITLNNAGNAVTTVDLRSRNAADSANAAGAISYRDTDGFAVAAAQSASDVTLIGGDAITQSGAIAANKLTAKTLKDSGAAITLNNSGNDAVSIDLEARNAADSANANGAISYRDANGFDIFTARSAGTISLTAGDLISQTGVIEASTLTAKTLNDFGAPIFLGNFGNEVSAINLQSRNAADTLDAGGTVFYVDASGFNVTGARGSGFVTLIGHDAITQSGAIVANTLTAWTLKDGGAAITLNNAGNDAVTVNLHSWNGAGTLNAAGAISYRDTSGFTVVSAQSTGPVTLTGGNAIDQSGTIAASSLAVKTLNDAGAAITLNLPGNEVAAVDLQARNAADTANANGQIDYRDTTGFSVTSARTLSAVNLTAGDLIAQSGAIEAGTLTAKTLNDAGAPITLNNSANQVGAIDLEARNALDNANAPGAIDFADTTGFNILAAWTASTLNLTANGPITQFGAIAATTLTARTLDDAGSAITLNNSLNEVTAVNLQARNAADSANANGAISYTDATGFDVAAVQTGGALNLTAGGSMTQSGLMDVGGASTFTVTAPLADVLFGNAGNLFAAVTITASGAGNSVRDVALGNASATASFPVLDPGLRNLTLNFGGAAINLPALTLSGDLAATSGKQITQSGALIVNGPGASATFAAGAGFDITLNNPANDFTTASFTSGQNVTLTDVNGISLGASTLSGSLGITAGGPISQSGALIVNGPAATATFAAGSLNDVTLNLANDFTSVAITSGRNVVLNDVNAIKLGASTISGNLSVTAAGPITETGALTVNGPGSIATFAAGSGSDITLSLANDFNSVGIVSGRDVSLNDVSGIDLAASTVSGMLGVTAAGPITQSGALNVSGMTTLAAGALNDIVLFDPANHFSSVGITSGRTVLLRDADGIDLKQSTAGFLEVVAGGPISQSGVIMAASLFAFTLNDAGANITLNNPANDVTGQVYLQALNAAGTMPAAGEIRYSDANGFVVAGVGTTGNAILTSGPGGQITQTGPILAGGLAINAGGSVTLGNLNNQVGLLAANVTGSGNSFSYVQIFNPPNNNLALGNVDGIDGIHTLGGNVTLTAPNGNVINPQLIDAQGGTVTLVTINGTVTLLSLVSKLAALSYVDISTPKVTSSGIASDPTFDPSKFVNRFPSAITTYGLQVPFAKKKEGAARAKIEEQAKWTGGDAGMTTTTAVSTPGR